MWLYVAVSVLGALLGSAELISRYRDEPAALIRLPAAYLYLLFNAVVSCSALYLIGENFPIPGVAEDDSTQSDIYRVLIAGFGGAAFFRSSVARTKVGDVEIGIGPSFMIDAFLGAADRAIDRDRALSRTRDIPTLMREIPMSFAAEALTRYCVGSLQNLSAADEKILETRTAVVLNAELPPSIGSMLIGMVLSEYVGKTVLEEAIEKLKPEIDHAREQQKLLQNQLDEDAIARAIEGASDADVDADADADADTDADADAIEDGPEAQAHQPIEEQQTPEADPREPGDQGDGFKEVGQS